MLRRIGQRLKTTFVGTAEFWWLPALLGMLTAAGTWTVWHFTKITCTAANALEYQCNPSLIASFIDVDVLSRSITNGAILATLAGGLNIYMFAKEREARIAAEERLAEERKGKDELLEEFRLERRRWEEQLAEERRRSDQQRQRAEEHLAEERRRAEEIQQAMLAAITNLTAQIAESGHQGNGNGQPG